MGQIRMDFGFYRWGTVVAAAPPPRRRKRKYITRIGSNHLYNSNICFLLRILSKKIEILLASSLTQSYAVEYDGKRWKPQIDGYSSVEQLKQQCRYKKLSPGGNKYYFLRLVQHDSSKKKKNSPTVEKNRKTNKNSDAPSSPIITRKLLEGDALEKRKTLRLQKLNKQIDERLQWKKTLSFKIDEKILDCQLYGKSYRYGAYALLKAPASISLYNDKLSFPFKYTVEC